MPLKMECHSKWNVAQKNVIKNGISLKRECHAKQNVSQNGMWHIIKCHTKWNVSKMECRSK